MLAWLKSRRLVWRRRGASAKQKSLFTIFEYGGRLAADLALPRPKQVTSLVRTEVEKLLEPGDFFITRHSHALTNLFLPGFGHTLPCIWVSNKTWKNFLLPPFPKN